MFTPAKIFFTKGVGRHKDYLQSFELALRDAGIEICNLVTVSSIYPPGCKRIPKDEGVKQLSGAPVMASDLRASAALVLAGLAVPLCGLTLRWLLGDDRNLLRKGWPPVGTLLYTF